MALLSDELSVWDIGFRWAGHDPDRWWLWIPLEVKDTFRNLIDAILKGELVCMTISLEKRENNRGLPREFSVYYYLDEMHACIAGHRCNRKLLRWACVERFDFKLWCERRGIPLPEFWFPSRWGLEYELPDNELLPGHGYLRRCDPPENRGEDPQDAVTTDEGDKGRAASGAELPSVSAGADSANEEPAAPSTVTVASAIPTKEEAAREKLRPNQAAKIACQQIASVIWEEDPARTIASIIRDERIQKLGRAAYFEEDTVREWIKVVAPREVRARRGRPRKEKGSPEQ